jgi:hypothetical protein
MGRRKLVDSPLFVCMLVVVGTVAQRKQERLDMQKRQEVGWLFGCGVSDQRHV